MSDDLYDGPCVAGCQHYHGGEVRHHKDCGHYAESLTRVFEDRIRELEAEVAATREARGVRVKLLAWRDSYGVLRAETPYGDYKVAGKLLTLPGAQGAEMVCESAFAARVAAQADYERRILATLEPAPVTPAQAARVLLCDQGAMRAMCRAAASSRAHDDEGQFEPLLDLINFSGENKTRMVIFAAIYDALRALADAGEAAE